MICAVVQPSYLPWRGYFHMLQKADVFVFYDDVQYDKHGWRNRNRIKTAQGPQWLTVPVSARGNVVNGTPIDQVRIADQRWPAKHLAGLKQAYARAPHIDAALALVEPHLTAGHELLADLDIALTRAIAASLGLAPTYVRSSGLGVAGERMDRLVSVLERVGATHYVSGPAARAYLDESRLAAANISLEYMTYEYAEYPQLHDDAFEPQVSVLDLIAMVGPDRAGEWIWSQP